MNPRVRLAPLLADLSFLERLTSQDILEKDMSDMGDERFLRMSKPRSAVFTITHSVTVRTSLGLLLTDVLLAA